MQCHPTAAFACTIGVMGIHDWTRVDAGTWHSFHYSWIAEIKRSLNGGVLPEGYYAEAEKPAPPVVPDVLTFQEASDEIMGDLDEDDGYGGGGVAVATAVVAPPRMRLQHTASPDTLVANLPRTIAVRHESGDRLVALLELTSPSNKDRPQTAAAFANKAAAAIASGVHVSIIDLLPPPRHDAPHGLIPKAAEAAGLGDPADLGVPADKPLMVAAFDADRPPTLHAEPLAVGDALPDLPVFLRPGRHVPVPLASTYAAAWQATPRRWREVVAG